MKNHSFYLPATLAFLLAAAAVGIYYFLGADSLVAMLGTAPGLMLATGPLALRAQGASIAEIAQIVGEIGDGFNSTAAQLKAEQADLRREIERVEGKGNLHGLLGGDGDDAPSRRVVKATPAERKAFANFLRTGESRYAAEAKAVQVGVPGDGGYAVPTWFDAQVLSVMSRSTPLFDLVKRNLVSNFPARHIVSLGLSGAGWVNETAARPATNSPTLAIVENAGADCYANPQITRWALDDIHFNAEEWLSNEIGLELAANIQAAIVTGNGINQPLGFLTAPNATTSDNAGRPFGTLQFVKTGVAGGLPATTTALIDFLLAIVHSLNQRYRQGGAWLMNSTTLGELRKAKDTTNRPVLLDSLASGQPATLLGYSIFEVADMPDLAANAFPIAFGDFRRGYVLDEHEAGLRIIVDQVTNKPYIGFYSVRRVGGKPFDTNAIKLAKCAV